MGTVNWRFSTGPRGGGPVASYSEPTTAFAIYRSLYEQAEFTVSRQFSDYVHYFQEYEFRKLKDRYIFDVNWQTYHIMDVVEGVRTPVPRAFYYLTLKDKYRITPIDSLLDTQQAELARDLLHAVNLYRENDFLIEDLDITTVRTTEDVYRKILTQDDLGERTWDAITKPMESIPSDYYDKQLGYEVRFHRRACKNVDLCIRPSIAKGFIDADYEYFVPLFPEEKMIHDLMSSNWADGLMPAASLARYFPERIGDYVLNQSSLLKILSSAGGKAVLAPAPVQLEDDLEFMMLSPNRNQEFVRQMYAMVQNLTVFIKNIPYLIAAFNDNITVSAFINTEAQRALTSMDAQAYPNVIRTWLIALTSPRIVQLSSLGFDVNTAITGIALIIFLVVAPACSVTLTTRIHVNHYFAAQICHFGVVGSNHANLGISALGEPLVDGSDDPMSLLLTHNVHLSSAAIKFIHEFHNNRRAQKLDDSSRLHTGFELPWGDGSYVTEPNTYRSPGNTYLRTKGNPITSPFPAADMVSAVRMNDRFNHLLRAYLDMTGSSTFKELRSPASKNVLLFGNAVLNLTQGFSEIGRQFLVHRDALSTLYFADCTSRERDTTIQLTFDITQLLGYVVSADPNYFVVVPTVPPVNPKNLTPVALQVARTAYNIIHDIYGPVDSIKNNYNRALDTFGFLSILDDPTVQSLRQSDTYLERFLAMTGNVSIPAIYQQHFQKIAQLRNSISRNPVFRDYKVASEFLIVNDPGTFGVVFDGFPFLFTTATAVSLIDHEGLMSPITLNEMLIQLSSHGASMLRADRLEYTQWDLSELFYQGFIKRNNSPLAKYYKCAYGDGRNQITDIMRCYGSSFSQSTLASSIRAHTYERMNGLRINWPCYIYEHRATTSLSASSLPSSGDLGFQPFDMKDFVESYVKKRRPYPLHITHYVNDSVEVVNAVQELSISKFTAPEGMYATTTPSQSHVHTLFPFEKILELGQTIQAVPKNFQILKDQLLEYTYHPNRQPVSYPILHGP